MTPKLKSPVFIDTLVFDLSNTPSPSLNVVLRDDQGRICNSLNTAFEPGLKTFYWSGFNELPYGVYTLELSEEKEKKLLNLVKRV
ncbi:MAG: hypothetical protein KF862_03150 [Chitinophagaceae bacterium]|nr:hypothetical protein [Chitinophagaceae bacterium]